MSGIIGGAGSKSGVIGQTELDYEEGTWTPAHSTFTFDTTPTGSYIKIGNVVTCWGYFEFSNASTNSTAFTGLPYTGVSTSNRDGSGTTTCNIVHFWQDSTFITPYVHAGSATWNFYSTEPEGGWSSTLQSATNSSMYFMIHYRVV